MLKKILFLFFILFSQILLSDTLFDDFIDEQIKVEAKFLDQNLTLDEKVEIKEAQELAYRKFFLLYASDKEKHLQEQNPHRGKIARLKLHLNHNKYRNNVNAVKRDRVLLKSFAVRNMLREILQDTLIATQSKSKDFFKDEVNEILLKYLSKYKQLDTKEYLSSTQDKTSSVIIALHEAIQNHTYLENVVNTFTAILLEDSIDIYKIVRISNSKFFKLLNTTNASPYALEINTYLDVVYLDIAKIIFMLAFIFILYLVHLLIPFIINKTLHYYKLKEDDIEYIHLHITKLFNLITSVLIAHGILFIFLGFGSKDVELSKIFAIFYVLATMLMLYRIIHIIAYLKMDKIQNSKLVKNEVINLGLKVINGFIILIAIIFILRIFGANLTALLSGLGIAGAAIAFAAKDSISNVFASVSILISDVFEQGDWIETKDVNGTVVEIGLRASTIRTFDNALISIPNSELTNLGVKNWTRRHIGRRIKLDIRITYQSDFNDIRQAISDIRKMLREHPGIAGQRTEYKDTYPESKLVSKEDYKGIKRTTLVYMDEFADSSINILVYCFSHSVNWEEWLKVKEDVMFKLADILKKNNLKFAYPSLALYRPDESTNDTEETK